MPDRRTTMNISSDGYDTEEELALLDDEWSYLNEDNDEVNTTITCS